MCIWQSLLHTRHLNTCLGRQMLQTWYRAHRIQVAGLSCIDRDSNSREHVLTRRSRSGMCCAPTAASSKPTSSIAEARLGSQQAATSQVRSSTSGVQSGSRQELVLYNSLTREKETFKPARQGGAVTMYVCGVTAYDYSHIGHARVYISFDLLYRYLRYLGYEVKYVRNFTDIDDKIIKRAKESGCKPLELSQRFIREFHTDMEALNCLQPSLEPRATEYVQAMIQDVEQILANGHAYESGGDVFFDVASLPGYGRLSGRKQEDNRAGERVAVDRRKRNAADFVLWKAAKEGEPSWDSRWGAGRPGWHMECSSMIRRTLGPAIDIHGGGRDLVFPHHENEMAQAEAAVGGCACGQLHPGRGFVNFWLHNGFVTVDSEKMSKSLGNFFTIREVTKVYHPLALRFFLLSSQYRAAINYTQRNLDSAADRLYYTYQTLQECGDALDSIRDDPPPKDYGRSAAQLWSQFQAGLNDDLNTSPAFGALSEALKRVNDLCNTKQGKKVQGRLEELQSLFAGFEAVLSVLGLWQDDFKQILQELRALALKKANLQEEDVEVAITRRAEARKQKDFAAADAVRLGLAEKGIMIMDTPKGTTWRPQYYAESSD